MNDLQSLEETGDVTSTRFPGDVDVDEVLEEVLKVSSTSIVVEAFNKLTDCWIQNTGIVSHSDTKLDPRMSAFIGLRALLDFASGTNDELKTVKKKDYQLPPKQFVAKLLNKLFDATGEVVKGSRLQWHTHTSVGFLSNGLSHMIGRLIPTGGAYLMLYTAIKQLGILVREPVLLSSKSKPVSKKKAAQHKQNLMDAEGALFNWKFMIQVKIIIDVLGSCRTQIDLLDTDGDLIIDEPKQVFGDETVTKTMRLYAENPCSETLKRLSLDDKKKLTKCYDEVLLLSYPLYQMMMACLKFKWLKAGYVSFNCQLIRRLVELQMKVKTFVPVGVVLAQMMEQLASLGIASRRLEGLELKKDTGMAYTSLRLSEKNVNNAQVIDDLWQQFLVSLTMYSASLATHPSYPEIIVPLGNSIRTLQKNNHEIPTTFSKDLTTFMHASKAAADHIKKERETIQLTKVTHRTMELLKPDSAMAEEFKRIVLQENKSIQEKITSTVK
eukprot:GHVH01001544.1.p1 GENE.GHVH01001544.1~~GHVH01001544.1.p1  ORF type:complete len:496 (-),score=93.18 GHVH01001544.1:114-1601(-)